jgi:hypothetical protein
MRLDRLKIPCEACGEGPAAGQAGGSAGTGSAGITGMDQFSFHGPYAYRWVEDVPVERIHLLTGERRTIEIGDPCPVSPPRLSTASAQRAAMASWN